MLIINSGFNISQAKLILKLVSDEMNVKRFLTEVSTPEAPHGFKIITLEELGKSISAYMHEIAHICAWAKHGITVEIIKKVDELQHATGTQNLKEVCENYSKNKLIEILKDAYFAPYKSGIRSKIFWDLLIYEVLCGNANIQVLNDTEVAIQNLLRHKYADLAD